MAEVRETHIERRRGRGGLFLATFLVGGFLIGVAAVVVMNVQGSLYWPAGRVNFNLSPTASNASTAVPATTAEATTPPTAVSAPAPAESSNSTTAPEPSSAPSDASPPESTAPAETQPQ